MTLMNDGQTLRAGIGIPDGAPQPETTGSTTSSVTSTPDTVTGHMDNLAFRGIKWSVQRLMNHKLQFGAVGYYRGLEVSIDSSDEYEDEPMWKIRFFSNGQEHYISHRNYMDNLSMAIIEVEDFLRINSDLVDVLVAMTKETNDLHA